MSQVPAPDRTVLTDMVLSQAVCTAAIDAPAGKVDIFEWLRALPDREFQRCAPPDHKAAGYTVTDDGRPMSVTVEMIGASLFVHHYGYENAGQDHCRLVSVSDVLSPAGWTSCQVIWELTAEPARRPDHPVHQRGDQPPDGAVDAVHRRQRPEFRGDGRRRPGRAGRPRQARDPPLC